MQHRLYRPNAQAGGQCHARAHFGLDLALQIQHFVGIAHKARARHRQAKLLVAPIEQQHAQLLFKRCHTG